MSVDAINELYLDLNAGVESYARDAKEFTKDNFMKDGMMNYTINGRESFAKDTELSNEVKLVDLSLYKEKLYKKISNSMTQSLPLLPSVSNSEYGKLASATRAK